MKFRNILTLGMVGSLVFLASCEKDEDEQENINTVRIELKDGATTVGTFTWTDPDGAGGNVPRVDTIRLAPNKTFAADVRFLNGAVTPNEDYTQEIKDEAADHLVIYTSSNASLTFTNLSTDPNGKAFGQTSNFITGGASSGNVRIVLKHKADKNNPTTTGETDVDVTLPVVIR